MLPRSYVRRINFRRHTARNDLQDLNTKVDADLVKGQVKLVDVGAALLSRVGDGIVDELCVLGLLRGLAIRQRLMKC